MKVNDPYNQKVKTPSFPAFKLCYFQFINKHPQLPFTVHHCPNSNSSNIYSFGHTSLQQPNKCNIS